MKDGNGSEKDLWSRKRIWSKKRVPKIILVKKYHPEKLMVRKIFGLKRMYLVEINSTATKFSIQKCFGSENKGNK